MSGRIQVEARKKKGGGGERVRGEGGERFVAKWRSNYSLVDL